MIHVMSAMLLRTCGTQQTQLPCHLCRFAHYCDSLLSLSLPEPASSGVLLTHGVLYCRRSKGPAYWLQTARDCSQ